MEAIEVRRLTERYGTATAADHDFPVTEKDMFNNREFSTTELR